MLVHEDGAIRARMRFNSVWKDTSYPAIITHPYRDVIVGDDVARVLPAGYTLALRGGCCDNPTHWMPMPDAPPASTKEAK